MTFWTLQNPNLDLFDLLNPKFWLSNQNVDLFDLINPKFWLKSKIFSPYKTQMFYYLTLQNQNLTFLTFLTKIMTYKTQILTFFNLSKPKCWPYPKFLTNFWLYSLKKNIFFFFFFFFFSGIILKSCRFYRWPFPERITI